jgi:uncharacterized protein (TIGR03032 family)
MQVEAFPIEGPKLIRLKKIEDARGFFPEIYNKSLFQPPFITELAPEDRCHLNGMAFADGQVRYATMLGTSNEPRGWRDGMAEGGVLMEVPSGRVVTRGLSMPHSPRLFGERLYVLEGGRGQLLGVDPVS